MSRPQHEDIPRAIAVLLVSEDLDGLLELSDRLAVMFHGKLIYQTRASDADLTEIDRHMAWHLRLARTHHVRVRSPTA
jgi:ABC-type uncharacterized transport system ATPase subunit